MQRIELAEDGKARILIDVPSKDARWLRSSSVFTMERGLVGDTRIRAYSGVLTDPPLPDGAERSRAARRRQRRDPAPGGHRARPARKPGHA